MVNPRLFLPALTLLACAAPLRADDDGVHWNVTAECQMVTLPQKAALALLPELLSDKKIDAAFTRIQDLIANGSAQLAANLVGMAVDEGQIVSKSVEEIRYGTEFDPPNLPQGPVEKPETLEKWPVVGVTTTAYETREIGTTITLETGAKKDGQPFHVSCEPQHVRLLRMVKIDNGKLPNGGHLFIEQPIFHTLKNNCSLMLRSGQRVLLGMHKLTEPANTMELFFLRVTVTRMP